MFRFMKEDLQLWIKRQDRSLEILNFGIDPETKDRQSFFGAHANREWATVYIPFARYLSPSMLLVVNPAVPWIPVTGTHDLATQSRKSLTTKSYLQFIHFVGSHATYRDYILTLSPSSVGLATLMGVSVANRILYVGPNVTLRPKNDYLAPQTLGLDLHMKTFSKLFGPVEISDGLATVYARVPVNTTNHYARFVASYMHRFTPTAKDIAIYLSGGIRYDVERSPDWRREGYDLRPPPRPPVSISVGALIPIRRNPEPRLPYNDFFDRATDGGPDKDAGWWVGGEVNYDIRRLQATGAARVSYKTYTSLFGMITLTLCGFYDTKEGGTSFSFGIDEEP
jgi:hypothetical protein